VEGGVSPATRLEAEAREGLELLWERLREGGCAAPGASPGKLIRPALALAGAAALGRPRDEAVWAAAAAVQLAHEASLVHDDVIDTASVRRNQPTLVAARGVAAALVEGDHLLTTAYRLAATTSSPAFVSSFSYAVERTVAGEKLQGRAAGLQLDEASYRRVIGLKSGELLGCALAAAPLVAGDARASEWYALGRSLGVLYQLLDDLLDYCPDYDTGKPALGDYAQRRWTWPLLEAGDIEFGHDAFDVAARLAEVDATGTSPLRRCLLRFLDEAAAVRARLALHMPGDVIVEQFIAVWSDAAAEAVERAEAAHAERCLRALVTQRLGGTADLRSFFRANSRSFSLAARLFPAQFRRRVEGIYAFCRITDDLADADDGGSAADRMQRLAGWQALARRAYDGGSSGLPFLDEVMLCAAQDHVPFEYIEMLIEGMRMDVRNERYEDAQALRVYCHRVAGVVGQWLTRACGVHDADTLEHAAALGHAMQVTNILRDVGEDARRGRLYLPQTLLRDAGITEHEIMAGAFEPAAAPRREAWVRLHERLMAVADRDYAFALEALPRLPAPFRRAVRVAAHVYRGIHDEIRANAYDTLGRRAHTSTARKLSLAVRALAAPQRVPAAVPLRAHPRHGALLVTLLLAGAAAPVAAQAMPAQPLPPAAHAEALHARLERESFNAAIALDLVRARFFEGVDDAAAVGHGRGALLLLREHDADFSARHAALLSAYAGAFSMLEAKHGRWPHARLRAVRSGLAQLDAAVARKPDDLEVRYLRLVCTWHLPGLFGRRDSARDDLRAVRLLLAEQPDVLPTSMHGAVVAFLAGVR
jgi:15-cis-phytoene synthase